MAAWGVVGGQQCWWWWRGRGSSVTQLAPVLFLGWARWLASQNLLEIPLTASPSSSYITIHCLTQFTLYLSVLMSMSTTPNQKEFEFLFLAWIHGKLKRSSTHMRWAIADSISYQRSNLTHTNMTNSSKFVFSFPTYEGMNNEGWGWLKFRPVGQTDETWE